MPNQTVELPIQNFPAQETIFKSQAKFAIAAKGRRFGLTRGAANNFIKEALEEKFTKGLWVDVVNANIDRYIERYFIPTLQKLPKSMWDWKKQAHILWINKAYIDFRSADTPENIEGFGYDKAFINEAGIVLKDEYLWDHAIRPMFWDYPCRTVLGGTPKGKGKFFELAERGKDPLQTNYEFFTFTSFDNPYLNISALTEDMRDMPEMVIKQEVYAEFLDDSGTVFRGIVAIANATPQKPQDGHYYTMGVDLAKLQDWTVITVYDRATNSQVYQSRFNKLEWPVIKNRVAETAKHYNDATVILDSTGVGEPIFDDLARGGVNVIPFKFTNETKKQLIEKLSTYIELKRIKVLNLPETIREFTNFTYDISETTGRIRYEAPVGFNDDIVISHGLAVWDLQPVTRERILPPKTVIQQEYARAKYNYTAGESGEYEGSF